MIVPSSGFHYGVPFESYRQWPAVNISTLKPITKTPLHCRYAMDHPRESDELNVGSALHVRCFESARFDKEFYVGQEEYNATTKEGRAVREREIAEAAGRTYLRRKAGDAVDCDSVIGMSAALWEYRPAKKFLEMSGQCEVSALWQDKETELMCKGRFDKLIPAVNSPVKRPVLVELKSTRDGSESAFNRDLHKLGYAIQAAYYCWAVKEITGETPMHVFLGCENTPPYAPFWGTLDDSSLAIGATEFRRCLNLYAECAAMGSWPGFSEDVRILSLPVWAQRESA